MSNTVVDGYGLHPLRRQNIPVNGYGLGDIFVFSLRMKRTSEVEKYQEPFHLITKRPENEV